MDQETFAPHHVEDVEIQEWLESLDSVLLSSGTDVAREILERLRAHATVSGIDLPFTANTPYANTIPARLEPLFPGDQQLERRIKTIIRWNAMAMVVRANLHHNIGGHISSFASSATLYEVASITFSAPAPIISPAISFIFRATLRPAFIPAHFWKAA